MDAAPCHTFICMEVLCLRADVLNSNGPPANWVIMQLGLVLIEYSPTRNNWCVFPGTIICCVFRTFDPPNPQLIANDVPFSS